MLLLIKYIGKLVSNNVPLDKLNECKVYGKIMLFDEIVDGDLKWNKDYGSTVVCDGRLSIVVSLDIRPSDNGFDFFISESNLLNIKEYLSVVANSELKSEIKTMDFQYNDLIAAQCILEVNGDNEATNMDFNYKKVSCQVAGCKKKVPLVKMRMHIGWHILNKDLESHSHRCGFCGFIGCSLSIITTSGFGVNATTGPKSDCKLFYKFKNLLFHIHVVTDP